MDKSVALLTGSFDPMTLGHLSLVLRSARIFDKLYLTAFINPQKDYMFSVGERLEMMRAAVSALPNVEVDHSSGTVADYVREKRISVIIRGIRNPEELEYELSMAGYNKEHGGAETFFLPADSRYSELSSTAARDMIKKGKSLEGILPIEILNMKNRPF